MGYSSKLVESAVEALAMLPGVGKKTALRLALFLVDQDETKVREFSEAVWKMRNEILHCRICHANAGGVQLQNHSVRLVSALPYTVVRDAVGRFDVENQVLNNSHLYKK